MRSRSGFTLLEVLAAVAILAIAYGTLGASGIQGLQHEGEARRRLMASLLADSVLAEIESGIERGVAPEVGSEEQEMEGFRVVVEVEPYTLALPEEDAAQGKRLGHARSRLGGDAAATPAPIGASLLGVEGSRGVQPPLRRVSVQVVWDEGFGERVAVRTTYALDAEAAAATLETLAQVAAAADAGTGGPAPDNPLGGRNENQPPNEQPQ
jgi:prepilin-type N-terminal cleavage/methylation domain-containing protein